MKITFKNTGNTEFFSTLKKRVDAYFKSKKLKKQGDWRMILKTVFIVIVLFSGYGFLVSNNISNGLLALLVCALLGMFTAFAGFNMAHDGAHGAYASKAGLNTLMQYSFDFLGCSSYMWKINHNILHHTYTNIPNHDNDLEPVFFIRLNPLKKIYAIHRFQHWYASFFYGLTSLSWVFKKDFSIVAFFP